MPCKHEGGTDVCNRYVGGGCKVLTKLANAAYRAANPEKNRVHGAAYRASGQHRCEHGKNRNTCFLCRPLGAIKSTQRSANIRGYAWNISDAMAVWLAKQPCIYCGKESANGIDRQNNKYGYTRLNSVPCCGRCNYMKRTDRQKDFILACKAVAAHCVDKETFTARTKKIQQDIAELWT